VIDFVDFDPTLEIDTPDGGETIDVTKQVAKSFD
jgi:hypothetical protein